MTEMSRPMQVPPHAAGRELGAPWLSGGVGGEGGQHAGSSVPSRSAGSV